MAPPARRTWARRGRTPELVQRSGTREKVSVAASVGLSPRRDRLGLYSHTLANGPFDSWDMAAFLKAMLKNLSGRFVVVWDGGPMHEGDPIRDLMGHFADRLDLERLPPYAPMLDPVEPLWSWLKWGRLRGLKGQNPSVSCDLRTRRPRRYGDATRPGDDPRPHRRRQGTSRAARSDSSWPRPSERWGGADNAGPG